MACIYTYAYIHIFAYVSIKYLWKDRQKQLTWSPRGEIEWLGDREVE